MDTQRLLLATGVLCLEGPMSTCAGFDSQRCQEGCGQYEKASFENRCMYLMFDEYCDSVDAQAASRGHVIPMKRKVKIRDKDEYLRRRSERDRSEQRREIRIRRRFTNERSY